MRRGAGVLAAGFGRLVADEAVRADLDRLAELPPGGGVDVDGSSDVRRAFIRGLLVGLGEYSFVGLALGALMVACMWLVFRKAGRPGWAAIVPIYNWVVLLQITGRSPLGLVWLLVPIANVVYAIVWLGILVPLSLAASFGRGLAFGIGLIVLPWVFWPILAFGKDEYGA